MGESRIGVREIHEAAERLAGAQWEAAQALCRGAIDRDGWVASHYGEIAGELLRRVAGGVPEGGDDRLGYTVPLVGGGHAVAWIVPGRVEVEVRGRPAAFERPRTWRDEKPML